MARGSLAKEQVEKKIIEAFGGDYVGTIDKKIYVWANDGSERVQIAISMTCPKNPIEAGGVSAPISTDGFGLDFDNMPAAPAKADLEYTQEEKDTINDLISKLGL